MAGETLEALQQGEYRLTLLVGLRAHGSRVLRLFLRQAAQGHRLVRGVPTAYDRSPAHRPLARFRLIVADEPSPTAQTGTERVPAALEAELERDLCEVRAISASLPSTQQAFAAAFQAELRSLQSQELRSGHVPGLDIFLVCDLDDLEVQQDLPRFCKVLEETLEGLPVHQRASPNVTFLILGLSGVLNEAPGTLEPFRDLWVGLRGWQIRQTQAGRAGLSRLYLSSRGTRTEAYDAGECAKMVEGYLELLLFEGVRFDPSLRLLLADRRESDGDLLATVALKRLSYQRSALRQARSAMLGLGVLDFLLGDGSASPARLSASLERLAAQQEAVRAEVRQVSNRVRHTLTMKAGELLSSIRQEVGEPAQMMQWYGEAWMRQLKAGLERALAGLGARYLSELLETLEAKLARRIQEDRQALREALKEDLLDVERPASLSDVQKVLTQLKGVPRETSVPAPLSVEAPTAGPLEAEHAALQEMLTRAVSPGRLKTGLHVAALFGALLVYGPLRSLFLDLDPPGLAQTQGEVLSRGLYQVLSVVCNPLPLILVLGLVFLLGARAVHRALVDRSRFALSWYLDPAQGRIRAALSELATGPGNSILERCVRDLEEGGRRWELRALESLQQEASRLSGKVAQLSLEAAWLRRALQDIVAAHGIAPDLRELSAQAMARSRVRIALEQNADRIRLLELGRKVERSDTDYVSLRKRGWEPLSRCLEEDVSSAPFLDVQGFLEEVADGLGGSLTHVPALPAALGEPLPGSHLNGVALVNGVVEVGSQVEKEFSRTAEFDGKSSNQELMAITPGAVADLPGCVEQLRPWQVHRTGDGSEGADVYFIRIRLHLDSLFGR